MVAEARGTCARPGVSGQGCFRRGGRAGSATPPFFFFGPGPVTVAFPRRGRPCLTRHFPGGRCHRWRRRFGTTGAVGVRWLRRLPGRCAYNPSSILAQHRRSRPRALFLHRPGWGVTQQASSDAAPSRRRPAGAPDRRLRRTPRGGTRGWAPGWADAHVLASHVAELLQVFQGCGVEFLLILVDISFYTCDSKAFSK